MNIFKTSLRSGKASCILAGLGMLAAASAHAQQWNLVCPPAGISAGAASFQNLVKDANGNLYCSFYDLAVSKGSVMKYNGTSWAYLGGSAGITAGIATYNSLAVAGNGDVFYCNQAAYPASGINVHKFSGNSWSGLPDAEAATSNFQAMVTDASNMPVIAYSSGSAPKVKRYDGIAWNVLGTGLPSGVPYYIDIVAGTNDSIYVSWVGSAGMVVYKINRNASATDTWTQLGTTGFSATSSEQYRSAMAIDVANNVYVAFTSGAAGGNKLNVKKYSNGQWSDVGSANFSAYAVHYVSIAVNAAGMPYVAFSQFGNSPGYLNHVMRFSNGQWEELGAAVSQGEAKWNALMLDNAGNPVLAYSDASVTGGGNMVKKYTATTTCTNTQPGTTAGDVGCVTFNYKGQNVTYTTVRAADGNVWLQQNLGAAGVAVSKTDTASFGDLFQWGRWDDGHQNRNSTTGAIPSPNNPSGLGAGSAVFFTGSGTSAWWNGGQLSDTWNAALPGSATSATGADPCKAIGAGWRLPTQPEWAGVVAGELITNPDVAFSSNLKMTVGGTRSSSTGGFDFVGVRGYYWSSTTSSTGGKYYYFSASTNNPGAGNLRGGGASVRCLNTTGNVGIIDSIDVTTQNNVAAQITANGGTLQMQASVYPLVNSQDVTWNIVPGTGTATISTTGLVTAVTDGTVWAKAVSVVNTSKADSMQLTISNQVMPVASIDVNTLNNVAAAITSNGGTLQMISVILPANAVQDVSWSIVPGTGTAGISAAGLVTAATDGTVWAKAVSISNIGMADSMEITISNQVVAISSIDVVTQNNEAASIISNGGTLQVAAVILPSNAVQDVTWSIVPGTGTATISAAGLVTATGNGEVWAKAVAIADAAMTDSLLVTISGQESGNGTAIASLQAQYGLEAYPNPIQEIFTLQCTKPHPAISIEVADIYGRIVLHAEVKANDLLQPRQFSLGQLAAGTYVLSVRGAAGREVRKMVKQ